MKPSVSVCMATYNGSDYIREQLDSILPQLNDDDEIVISDDHSSDDTIERIKALGDPRIKISTTRRTGIHVEFRKCPETCH